MKRGQLLPNSSLSFHQLIAIDLQSTISLAVEAKVDLRV